MSGNTYFSLNGTIEYELRCDRCDALFHCRDDSYYSWPVLCAAAEAEGWRVQPGIDGEHRCTACAERPARRSPARLHRRRLARR